MPTNNRRVAAYLPPDVDQRLKHYTRRKGLKSESQAIIQILQSVLGADENPPALDRLTKLEERMGAIEELLKLLE